jgi:hypothetical protein
MTAIETRLAIRDDSLARLCGEFEREARKSMRATWKANARLYIADPWRIDRVVKGFNSQSLAWSYRRIKDRMSLRRCYGVTLNSEISLRAARLAIYILLRRERTEARAVRRAAQ